MKIILTVDTELWPTARGWPAVALPPEKRDFSSEYARYITGSTRSGEFGLGYQLALLERHKLRSTWFVEPLFSERAGERYLRNIVGQIRDHGQEIGLHLHTEWLGDAHVAGLPRSHRQFIRQFPLDEQRALIAWGKQRLLDAGAERVEVFRAGSFGANLDTAQALEAAGIVMDSSFNPSIDSSFPDLAVPREDAIHPFLLGAVREFPVATFRTLRTRSRHAQISACSASELRHALLAACAANWEVFVIFWHTGELVSRGTSARRLAIHVSRLEALCRFLDAHRDVLETAHFSELKAQPSSCGTPIAVQVPPGPTLRRFLEQLASRAI